MIIDFLESNYLLFFLLSFLFLFCALFFLKIERFTNEALEHKKNSICKKNIVFIFCAATVETAAVSCYLSNFIGKGEIVHLDDKKNIFSTLYSDLSNNIFFYVIGLNFQAQVEAASFVSRVMSHKEPDLVIMVGMCMGMPNKKLEVGTIIVPNEVFYFDHSRITSKNGVEIRPHAERVDTGLYRLARTKVTSESFDFKIIIDKPIASASTKIENQDSLLIRRIEETSDDIIAYDMEGWGFYQATTGKQCLWVKAVADSGESQNGSQDKKRGIQHVATKKSISFSILLAREFFKSKKH